MKGAAPIALTAFVQPCEQPVVIAAAEQLSECLGGPGQMWPIALHFAAEAEPHAPLPAIAITSLLQDVLQPHRTLPEVAAEWESRLAGLAAAGHTAIVLCNVFGCVTDPQSRPWLIERIRRLNLLAASLSQELGVGIVDMDRIFTVFGAAECRTGHLLGGRIAAEIGGHAIVSTLLALGLDGFVPPDIEAAAAARHGGLEQIAALVERRAGIAATPRA